ncbi:hypothetical protein CfE428DRAFT_0930 [Chthoniobacter flavus Ellin428]|uniref:Uncharacterized protein n=1 Tax=Chthoniobacter flavus Ellin428 TaxID=497964 RepID=B4CW93_9BACT|nr:hypothetical protein CfE428DRAFT_0930 [Chthoniobacter flavus Ellin428]TCO95623.1 hypothetical protein EV701_101310 [Chthoniobacter flavus]
MGVPNLASSPLENPQKLEVLRLRPCFPAPLRMTAFFGGASRIVPCAQREYRLCVFGNYRGISSTARACG